MEGLPSVIDVEKFAEVCGLMHAELRVTINACYQVACIRDQRNAESHENCGVSLGLLHEA